MAIILSLLPTQNEKLEVIIKRYNDIIRAVANKIYYNGILLDAHNPEVQAVLRALINKMSQQETKRVAHRRMSIHKNKTAHDKASPSYKTPEQKKKEKSEESRKVRLLMQGAKGRK